MTPRRASVLYLALTIPLLDGCGSDATGPEELESGRAVGPDASLLEPGSRSRGKGEEVMADSSRPPVAQRTPGTGENHGTRLLLLVLVLLLLRSLTLASCRDAGPFGVEISPRDRGDPVHSVRPVSAARSGEVSDR